MSHQKRGTEIDPTGQGYFGVPPPGRPELPQSAREDPWRTLEVAFHRATSGRFDGMPLVVDAYDPYGKAVFNRQCMELIGTAGPDDCIERIRQGVISPKDPRFYDVTLDYCFALSRVGKLADVPVILQAFKRHTSIRDAAILPVYISFMVEDEPSEIADASSAPSIQEYEVLVMERYQELRDEFGTDDVFLVGGQRLSVVQLAEHIRDQLNSRYFSPGLRLQFEAATGIDCRPFYKRGSLQRLAASAIVEKFLSSPEAERYETGIRYFFGHRIPALSNTVS